MVVHQNLLLLLSRCTARLHFPASSAGKLSTVVVCATSRLISRIYVSLPCATFFLLLVKNEFLGIGKTTRWKKLRSYSDLVE